MVQAVKEVSRINRQIQDLQVNCQPFVFYRLIFFVIGSAGNTAASGNEMDVTRLTEEEQIALAIEMSMSQADNSSKSSAY